MLVGRDDRKLGRATLTDFHKVKVIFVGEDVNNTSQSTSLPGGFTAVDTVFTARRYASAVLAVIVCLSVCHKSEWYKDG